MQVNPPPTVTCGGRSGGQPEPARGGPPARFPPAFEGGAVPRPRVLASPCTRPPVWVFLTVLSHLSACLCPVPLCGGIQSPLPCCSAPSLCLEPV